MEKCDSCGKRQLKQKKVDYLLYGENLGKFDAMVCENCQETTYGGDTFDLIEKQAKEKGLWGIAAKTRIGTSGNALDVKLPKALVDFLKLKKGQEVLISPIDNKRMQIEII